MYHRILVPYDGSRTSTLGLEEAIKLARLTGATLRLIHLADPLNFATGFESVRSYNIDVLPVIRRTGEHILEVGAGLADAAGVPVEVRLFDGPHDRLTEVVIAEANAWQADLIVIGTHGRRGVGRLFMGSDAQHILRASPVPVLAVRTSITGPQDKTVNGACPKPAANDAAGA